MEAIGTLLGHLASLGTPGAIVGAALIGLALIVVIVTPIARLVLGFRTDRQFGEFQERLLETIATIGRNEARLTEENARLREDIARQGVVIELMREQQRRAIDLLRRVMQGRVQPAEITPSDLEGLS